jgi:hypothetical protein
MTKEIQAVTTDASATPLDPFDPANLLLSQNFAETVGVKKLLTTIPVRRPSPQDFVRVHSSPDYRGNFSILELKDEREEYVVQNSIVPELLGEVVSKTLHLAINRQGVVFFWPTRLPTPDGKDNEWWRSAREAKEVAMQSWVRVKSNTSLGAYEIFQAESTMAEPVWPQEKFFDLIKIAFRSHLIDRLDHPAIDRLRGRV